MIYRPVNDFECLACDIMRRITEDNLLGVDVKDVDVGGDSDVLERDIGIRWSSQAMEQISAVIAEHFGVME